jgi:DNA-binding MarR family transcriptional regulator
MTGPRRPRRAEPGGKQKLRLWLRLLRVVRTIEVELRRRFALQFATTLPKFDVMAALARAENGMKMSELSRYLMVSNGNVTGIIDRLVTERLVERQAQPGDRRAIFVCLTDKGLAQFAAMAAAHESWIGEILSGYSRADTESLCALLSSTRIGVHHDSSGLHAKLGDMRAPNARRQRSDGDQQRLGRKRESGGPHVR